MKRLILFFALLVSETAFSRIIFIDLNNATKEVDAARDAALSRGEQPPIVIPGGTDEVRKKHDEASRAVDKVGEEVVRTCSDGASPACTSARTRYDHEKETLRALVASTRLTPAKLAAELRKLEAQGIKASSVVISGHDGNGQFAGVYGNMSSDDFSAAFSTVPGVSRNVRSVLLWGCYTTNLGSIDGYWNGIFPNVGVFAGFDGRGPSKYRQAGHQYLKTFLENDKALMAAGDRGTIESLIDSKIRGFSISDSSICTKDFIVTPAGEKKAAKARNISEIRRDCAIDNTFRNHLKVFGCFKEARGSVVLNNQSWDCKNPPNNTDPPNPLRGVYNFLKAKSHCRAYWSETGIETQIPEPQDVQSLLFFNVFKLNLANMHKGDLAKMDSLLQSIGAPPDLRVSDLPNLTRVQVLERLAKIDNFLSRSDIKSARNPNSIQVSQLRDAMEELNSVISDMKKAPPGWYEATATNPSYFLQNALKPERAAWLQNRALVERLDSSWAQAESDEFSRSSKAARIRSLEKERYMAISRGADASGADQAAWARRAEELNSAVVTLKSEVKDEINRVLVGRIRSQMAQQNLSPAEIAAYKEIIARRTPRGY